MGNSVIQSCNLSFKSHTSHIRIEFGYQQTGQMTHGWAEKAITIDIKRVMKGGDGGGVKVKIGL